MFHNPQDKSAVLFVGVGVPWVGGAGYLVRQSMLLSALARLDVNLHLALFDLDREPTTVPPPPFAASVTAIPGAKNVTESRIGSFLNDFVRRDPMLIRTLDCREARQAIARLQPERFDAVIAYRCDFAFIAGVLEHRNLILDIDDPEHVRRAEAARWTDDGNTAWQRSLDLRRLKRFEIECAQRAAACFVCQPRDALSFEQASVTPIVVPNCVEVEAACPRDAGSASREMTPSVLFLGNMQGSRQGPNVDAMLWLIEDIWPRIRKSNPEAECILAGPIRDEYRDLASQAPGVRVLGFVDDVRSLLRAATLSIAPIRFGTGTRIKILEAMAAGCPVASTFKGCEGIDLVHGRDAIVADDAQGLAEACSRLLDDPTLAAKIGRAGWQVVFDRYNRTKREQWLADVLSSLIHRSPTLAEAAT